MGLGGYLLDGVRHAGDLLNGTHEGADRLIRFLDLRGDMRHLVSDTNHFMFGYINLFIGLPFQLTEGSRICSALSFTASISFSWSRML